MISLHIFRRHTFCQQDSVRCFRRMWSRAGITRGSSRPSAACCPTRPPPPPGCPPGPSRRPRRLPSRRFSPASTSSYFPPTNTLQRTGKVFWIAWVINCRYCGDVTLNSLLVFRRGSDGSSLLELPLVADQVSGRRGDGLQGADSHVQGEKKLTRVKVERSKIEWELYHVILVSYCQSQSKLPRFRL